MIEVVDLGKVKESPSTKPKMDGRSKGEWLPRRDKDVGEGQFLLPQ